MKNKIKGLIICGYPGVGKSSIAGWNNCIDLESSWFSYDKDGNRIDPDEEWVANYCMIAWRLAMQGYTVLLSTHKAVINTLREGKRILDRDGIRVVIFVPRSDMKKAWIERLVNRYIESDEDVDLRAFVGGIQYWDTKMLTIRHSDFPVYCPDSIDYDFRDYILKIREKEGIADDPKAGPPMETMAGMEESSMDVPVVAKDPDIPAPEP